MVDVKQDEVTRTHTHLQQTERLLREALAKMGAHTLVLGAPSVLGPVASDARTEEVARTLRVESPGVVFTYGYWPGVSGPHLMFHWHYFRDGHEVLHNEDMRQPWPEELSPALRCELLAKAILMALGSADMQKSSLPAVQEVDGTITWQT